MASVKYRCYKLGRRADAFNKGLAAVSNGEVFPWCTVKPVVWDSQEGKIIEQDTFVPEIGKVVKIFGRSINDVLRTSVIQDFYIHGDYDNSKDKIVLKPENAELLKGLEFKDGDVVLMTMNSIYYLKAE